MKTKSFKRIVGGLGAAAIVAAGLVATVPHMDAAQDSVQAQGERVRPGGRGPGGRGGRMGGPMAGGFGEVMRDLTAAQQEQVKAIRERHAERMRPLMERVHAAREAVNAAVFSSNTGNLQGLSIEVGNAETELIHAQAQVQSEIFAVLTAEQKQEIAERRKQMETWRGKMIERRQARPQ